MSYDPATDTETDERMYELFHEFCRHRDLEPTIANYVEWLRNQDYDHEE